MKKYSLLPSLKQPVLGQTFKEKYVQTIGILNTNLQEFHPAKQMVAWSGGKDSTLILYLIRQECEALGIDPHEIHVEFHNTGVEYPQTIKFIRKLTTDWDLNLIETRPIKSFWQCVKEYGYPKPKSARIKDTGKPQMAQCCKFLKEAPALKSLKENGWECIYLGITAVESHQRQIRAVTHGTCYHNKSENVKKVHPILYWTEQEVWDAHRMFNIPYNTIYDMGVDRCGCMPCTAYKKWQENLQKTHPKMYKKIMRDMGQQLIS